MLLTAAQPYEKPYFEMLAVGANQLSPVLLTFKAKAKDLTSEQVEGPL